VSYPNASAVAVYLQGPALTFTESIISQANPLLANAQDIRFADVTRNGALDIVCAAPGSSLTLLRGQGDGSFGAAEAISSELDLDALAVGDLNGDGSLDAVAAQTSSDSLLAFLNADGAGGAWDDS